MIRLVRRRRSQKRTESDLRPVQGLKVGPQLAPTLKFEKSPRKRRKEKRRKRRDPVHL